VSATLSREWALTGSANVSSYAFGFVQRDNRDEYPGGPYLIATSYEMSTLFPPVLAVTVRSDALAAAVGDGTGAGGGRDGADPQARASAAWAAVRAAVPSLAPFTLLAVNEPPPAFPFDVGVPLPPAHRGAWAADPRERPFARHPSGMPTFLSTGIAPAKALEVLGAGQQHQSGHSVAALFDRWGNGVGHRRPKQQQGGGAAAGAGASSSSSSLAAAVAGAAAAGTVDVITILDDDSDDCLVDEGDHNPRSEVGGWEAHDDEDERDEGDGFDDDDDDDGDDDMVGGGGGGAAADDDGEY
jgi:hypothetical protein